MLKFKPGDLVFVNMGKDTFYHARDSSPEGVGIVISVTSTDFSENYLTDHCVLWAIEPDIDGFMLKFEWPWMADELELWPPGDANDHA